MHHRWWVLSAVGCGTFMATLDSSIVNVALPTLTKALGAELPQIKWLVIVYLLAITCLLLPFGRISDQFGRKKIFLLGFGVFTAASALCGFADGLRSMLLFRGLQGVGAAMLMANGPAVITATFPVNERGKALGTLAMVVSAGLVAGPSLGGFIVTHIGWEWIFWVNVPVGILGALLVNQYVTDDPEVRQSEPFDWAGAVLQLILIMGFIVVVDPPLISISGSALVPIPRWAIAATLVGFLALFIRIETDARAPLFDFELLRNRTFFSANLAAFLIFVAYSSLTVLMPFYLEEILRFSPDRAGLFMTVIPITVFVVAPISGRLSDRLGSRGLSMTGALVCAAAMFAMGGGIGKSIGIGPETWPGAIVIFLGMIGLSTGLFQSPNNSAILSSVPANKLGVASAILATVRNLGLVTGTGLATGVFIWNLQETGDFIGSLHRVLEIAALVSLGAAAASLAKKRGAHG